MKLLTLNFLTCARKACKQEPSAFPLHPRDAELERVEMEMNPEFLVNVLPRLEWKAIRSLGEEVRLLPISILPSCKDKNADQEDSSVFPPSLKQHQKNQTLWTKRQRSLHKHSKIYTRCSWKRV